MDHSSEWNPYAADMTSFTLPMICLIHPTNAVIYVDRSFNLQLADAFYSRLLSLAGFQFTKAHFSSLSLDRDWPGYCRT